MGLIDDIGDAIGDIIPGGGGSGGGGSSGGGDPTSNLGGGGSDGDGGGGGGGGGADPPNFVNTDPGGGSLPDWISDPSLFDIVPGAAESAVALLQRPAKFIRGIIFGTIFSGIAQFLLPIFNAITTVAFGSKTGTFAAAGETLGLADLPVAVAQIIGGAFGGVLSTLLTTAGDVIAASIPNVPGPFEVVIAAIVVLLVARYTADLVLPSLVVALEAVPVVGGPLSTLLGMVIEQ